MEVEGFTVEPLTSDRFDDLVVVLGEGGIGGCWCMYWTTDTTQQWRNNAKGGSTARNKGLMEDLVSAGPPPGLIAYDDGEPVAWCRVVARSTLPGLKSSTHFRTELDIDGVWSLPCFVVRKQHRGRGLTEALTRAAMAFAAEHDATTLEAYPWDTDSKEDPTSIYTGVASTFSRLGFEEVQRKAPHKPMMRLEL
jgi:ribosomal protein S18 acetylase RimI-like enzyme